MAKFFSPRTLGKFEDASASIPLRRLVRAFDIAGIRMGEDPGGADGARKVQFRRYIAGVDKHDPQQLDRLADALGSLIEEVATSKQDFLVKAAESDGFFFKDGTFRASTDDFASVDGRGKQLYLLANDDPKAAIAGAAELVESVCRVVLRLIGAPESAKKAGLATIVKRTLRALDLEPVGIDLEQLGTFVAGRGKRDLSRRHARLAVGASVTLAAFVAETYADRA